MNLVHLLRTTAQQRPHAPALVTGHGPSRRSVSFGDLDAHAARLSARFRASGLRPGDVVLVAHPVSIELYVILAALFRAGLVAMVPDPSAGRDVLQTACERCRPAAIVGPAKVQILRWAIPALRRIPRAFNTSRWPVPGSTRLSPTRSTERPGESAHVCVRDAADPALISFTSGSTGTPKRIVRSHGLLRSQYHALRDALDLTAGDVDLSALPIFVLANLAAGVTTVLPDADLSAPGAIDAEPVRQQLVAERPTRLTASPAFIERLLNATDERPDPAFASLRRVDTGGAPVYPAFLRCIQAALPSAMVSVVYGSTEAEPIAHVDASSLDYGDWDAMHRGDGLLVGRPVSAMDVRILPDRSDTPLGPFSAAAFDALALPPGEVGEIVVRGPHVVPGYLDGQGDVQTKIDVDEARWHRTGDAGRIDAQGRLWLLGRCRARLSGARGVAYPFSIECVADSDEGVPRTAALMHDGVPTLVVTCVATTDAARDAVAERLRARLAPTAIERLRFVDAIPMDARHNAKVDYPALRARLDAARSDANDATVDVPAAPDVFA